VRLPALFWLALGLILLSPAPVRPSSETNVPVLTDAEAWTKLPRADEGAGQPLPAWIRALATSLPRTAAAMIELDDAQRSQSPLPPRLRAKLRWFAAHANRCGYAEAYAAADYVRAGGQIADLQNLPGKLTTLPEEERLSLQLVKQLMDAGYSVSDKQIARLVELMGEKQVVAIVLVAAYSAFQDRLLLALGVAVEPNGPLPPVRVRFRRPPAPGNKGAPQVKRPAPQPNEKGHPRRKLSPPSKNPPPVPNWVDDPEWTAIPFETLRTCLSSQIARRHARIHVPDAQTVLKNLPDGVPRPERPTRIVWSLVTMGYQPRLAAAWSAGLRAFGDESDLDSVFRESMFWVVTRSCQCFY